MLFTSSSPACLLALLASTTLLAAAAPTVTEGLARRSTVSNGVRCYFSCPAIPDYTNTYSQQIAGSGSVVEALCQYTSNSNENDIVSCAYNSNTSDGAQINPEGASPLCPANLAGPDCSITGGHGYFKRADPAPRVLTPAEEAIKRRQYVPQSQL